MAKKMSINKVIKQTFTYMVAGSLALGVLCPISMPIPSAVAADATTMTDSEGAMFLDGEEVPLSFADSTKQILPISLTDTSYISITRTDSAAGALSAQIKSRASSIIVPDVTYPLAKDAPTDVIKLDAGEYYIVFEGVAGITCSVKSETTLGYPLTVGETVSADLDSETVYYYQFVAEQNGYLSVENTTKATKLSAKLVALDKTNLSKNNSLSKYSSSNHKKLKTLAGFGVMQGKEYLLAIQAERECEHVTFKTSMKYSKKYYKTVGGVSYETAKTIKKGKTYYCTNAAGENPCYYTFKKKSYAKNMFLKTSTLKNQGSVKMLLFYKEVKGAKKGQILPVKVGGKQIGYSVKSEYKKSLKIPANWPNVTYYAVFKRSNGTASGSYKLKLS